jgi:hypothetical protein
VIDSGGRIEFQQRAGEGKAQETRKDLVFRDVGPENSMRIARLGVLVIVLATAALHSGCSSSSTTAPSTTTPTSTNSSLISVTSTPPTFVLGFSGNIDVTITGNPTKTSTIKVDFGDQSAAVTMSAVSSAVFPHTYSKLGTFTVTVTVTMPDGSVAARTADVSVLP